MIVLSANRCTDVPRGRTPTADELNWAPSRTSKPQHLLTLIVWLRSYQRLGYFPKLDNVPAVVIKHVRACSVWTLRSRSSTTRHGRRSGIAG